MSTQRSLDELINRAEATLIAKTGQRTPAITAIACAIGGMTYGEYGYQDMLFRELHPETCSEAWLYLHANRQSTPRLLPTFATGSVQFEQTGGPVVIPKGEIIVSEAGLEYETTKEHYSDNPVPVIAIKAGAAGNLADGEVLKLSKGISGINPNNVVSKGIEGGADLEDVEHWRKRVVAAFEKSIRIGKVDDYYEWATSAHSDVDYAWAQDNSPERGQLEVYVGKRDDNPTVSAEVVNAVQANFELHRLAGCHPIAKLPQKMPLDIEIQGIEDTTIRANVVVALQDMVKAKMGQVNQIDRNTRVPESISPTEIVLTISKITTNFIVKSPTDEVVITKSQIHTLGNVSWTPPT